MGRLWKLETVAGTSDGGSEILALCAAVLTAFVLVTLVVLLCADGAVKETARADCDPQMAACAAPCGAACGAACGA
ncbi:hypothetical protein HPP92_004995 [Vanilla planifolia]|uniref:Uncharacterized protein n=1 Tax=Vanilla planifolia TaxID=51239 RepID=A0A835RK07_VANPL|nr:hypothetical protein HPP92_005306 [Vanilla planifolia]KAG0494001.1 hypothetical protein HPP92_004995 [Vanilla planifolia]